MEDKELTSCTECEHYFASDLYDGECYCEAKKDWFGGDLVIIQKFAINKCADYEG